MEKADVLDLLSRLVDKSLVVVEASGDSERRYRLLEPVRQYARELFEESEEAKRVRERHARYYLALAEEAQPELRGAQQEAWLERLEGEHSNLRAALSWALDREDAQPEEHAAELGLTLAAALWLFWYVYGLSEGHRWLEAALKRSSARSAVRAKALNGLGLIVLHRGDYERAVARLEEGLALSKELGDKSSAAISLAYLGLAALRADDSRRIKALREEAEAQRREFLDRQALAELLFFLAIAAWYEEGDYERSVALFEEKLALSRELEDVRGITMCIISLGMAALEHGDYERAAGLLEEGLRPLRRLRDKTGIAYGLLALAGVAGLRGEPARAARLWGAAEALREAIGLPLADFDHSHYDYENRLAVARAQLNEATWEAAWAEGKAMKPEEAVEYALSDEELAPSIVPPSKQPPASKPTSELTRREREVAVLVASGLTNRQVAAELVLSEHTVTTHVREIFKKLGFHSRAQIACWVVEQQPLP